MSDTDLRDAYVQSFEDVKERAAAICDECECSDPHHCSCEALAEKIRAMEIAEEHKGPADEMTVGIRLRIHHRFTPEVTRCMGEVDGDDPVTAAAAYHTLVDLSELTVNGRGQ